MARFRRDSGSSGDASSGAASHRPKRRAVAIGGAAGSLIAASLAIAAATGVLPGGSRGSSGCKLSGAMIYETAVSNPSSPSDSHVERVDLVSGAWQRLDAAGTWTYCGDTLSIVDTEDARVTTRTGSAQFTGAAMLAPVSVRALKAMERSSSVALARGVVAMDGTGGVGTKLRYQVGSDLVDVTISRRLSPAEARAERIFEQPIANVGDNRELELAVGSPAEPGLGVEGYWFGPTSNGREARFAVQRHFGRNAADRALGAPQHAESDSYGIIYEVPGQARTSAFPSPDVAPPAGEIQVSSFARTSGYAQATLRSFDGAIGDSPTAPWPREPVTLANGAGAVIVPLRFEGPSDSPPGFAVITPETLVVISASSGTFTMSEVRELAQQLRPV